MPRKVTQFLGSGKDPELTVQVTTREQITGRLLKMAPAVLYVPLHILASDLRFCQTLASKQRVCAVLPRIVHDGEMEALKQNLRNIVQAGVQEALVGNLGLLIPVHECGLKTRGDFGLNL